MNATVVTPYQPDVRHGQVVGPGQHPDPEQHGPVRVADRLVALPEGDQRDQPDQGAQRTPHRTTGMIFSP